MSGDSPFAYRAVLAVAGPLIRVLVRPSVRGADHVPAGGLVLCANHQSLFDIPALGWALRPRWLRHMAKPALFRGRVSRRLVVALGGFPAEGLDRAVELVRAGHAVVVMPEGHRRRAGRHLYPHTGAARIALAAPAPLLPAAIRGTDGTRRLRRWQVSFGPPVDLDGLGPEEATEHLWSAIRTLEDGLSRPDGPRPG